VPNLLGVPNPTGFVAWGNLGMPTSYDSRPEVAQHRNANIQHASMRRVASWSAISAGTRSRYVQSRSVNINTNFFRVSKITPTCHLAHPQFFTFINHDSECDWKFSSFELLLFLCLHQFYDSEIFIPSCIVVNPMATRYLFPAS
jgi:hypothetical protein